MKNKSRELVVVGLGEALLDRFPDRLILGGAPLNLAFHAHQILTTLDIGHGTVATRVGDDEHGVRVARELAGLGMPTDAIQVDNQRPTGEVLVEFDEQDEPHYTITENAAWDVMQFDKSWAALAKTCAAVCFGTLAQRSPQTRQAIYAFLDSTENALRICDINLRMNYHDEATLRASLAATQIVKLNEEELQIVSSALNPADAALESVDQVRNLIAEFDLRLVALTRGANGTLLITADEIVDGEVPTMNAEPGADTVGAGDASCAGLIVGLLLGWPKPQILELSNRMGAYVASRAGATVGLDDAMREWIRKLVEG